MELSAQRSAASSLQGLGHNRSRPQASLLPPAASIHGKHVISQLQQVLNLLLLSSDHVIAQYAGHRSHAAAATPADGLRARYIYVYLKVYGIIVLETLSTQTSAR
jgi:hypothetical protein